MKLGLGCAKRRRVGFFRPVYPFPRKSGRRSCASSAEKLRPMPRRFGSLVDETPASTARLGISTAAAVKAEQIRTLYRQSTGIVVVNPLNAAIVAALLWSYSNSALLAAWVAATIAVTIARAILRRWYLRKQPPLEETSVWVRRFVIGATATGLLWGLGGALFYSPHALAPQLLVIFVIGGMVAGASGVLALHLPAFLGFAVSAILPVAVRMLAEGDPLDVAMGILAIVYGVAMVLVAAN